MDKHESPDALGVTDARGICIRSQVLVHRQDRMLIGKTVLQMRQALGELTFEGICLLMAGAVSPPLKGIFRAPPSMPWLWIR